MNRPVCVVVGVGPGNGAAFAHRFAKAGYALALLARSTDFSSQLTKELSDSRAYECDVSDVSAVIRTFKAIQKDFGRVDVLIYNAGSGSWGTVEEITPAGFEADWRINTLGLLTTSQAVIPQMKILGGGNIVIVGATASRRGGVKTASFAPAKAAQRSLAESMAKTLWPLHIHVALIIIDGVVNLPKTREAMPDKPESFFVEPESVAETAYWLTTQSPSAWSFEVEARPFSEKW